MNADEREFKKIKEKRAADARRWDADEREKMKEMKRNADGRVGRVKRRRI
jgi:hypothetical protein